MPRHRTTLPRLLSRSWQAWALLVGAFLGGLGVAGWYAATDEGNRPYAVGLAAVMLLTVLVVTARRQWIDDETGEVVVVVVGVWRRRWRLVDPSVVRIVPNHAGQVLLRVEDAGRRTPFHHPLVADDLGGVRAQPPQHLRALAEVIDRWEPHQRAVVDALRAQADHLLAGGAVHDSPLAQRYLSYRPGTYRAGA